MKRKILLIICLFFLTIFPVQAEEDYKTQYPMLLEDDIYTFFYPLEKKATEKYFGEFKQTMFFCKFVDVKRKPNMGYAYEITYQFISFEKAHNYPYHLFTMTVDNKELTNWVINNIKVKKLDGEDVKCRKPQQVH
ncbi:hypothetical protein ACFSCX_23275 [Bacillus salitolerans]|uniref:DUF3888 domain-containing protein n=1 Tax=Bacillus salitolerans TaxID=1437434 RepID=A0ABW4LYC3_9BACI